MFLILPSLSPTLLLSLSPPLCTTPMLHITQESLKQNRERQYNGNECAMGPAACQWAAAVGPAACEWAAAVGPAGRI